MVDSMNYEVLMYALTILSFIVGNFLSEYNFVYTASLLCSALTYRESLVFSPQYKDLQHRAGSEKAIGMFLFVVSIFTGDCKVAFPCLPVMFKVLVLCSLFVLPVDCMEC